MLIWGATTIWQVRVVLRHTHQNSHGTSDGQTDGWMDKQTWKLKYSFRCMEIDNYNSSVPFLMRLSRIRFIFLKYCSAILNIIQQISNLCFNTLKSLHFKVQTSMNTRGVFQVEKCAIQSSVLKHCISSSLFSMMSLTNSQI